MIPAASNQRVAQHEARRSDPETAREPLRLRSQMAENGVIFSDRIEADFLEFNSGAEAQIAVASVRDGWFRSYLGDPRRNNSAQRSARRGFYPNSVSSYQ